jgi:hypothetical protein
MGRYIGYGYRTEVDGLLSLDIVKLKELGFLRGNSTQTVIWTSHPSEAKNRITLTINLYTKLSRLVYTATDRYTGEKTDYDYQIALESTPCNLGGYRWWFICPLVVSGRRCGRRVRKLYKNGSYFGCRDCQGLCYSSQNVPIKYRYFYLVEDSANKADKAYSIIKTPYYKGRPTRKMRRYLQLEKRSAYYAAHAPSFDDLFEKM